MMLPRTLSSPGIGHHFFVFLRFPSVQCVLVQAYHDTKQAFELEDHGVESWSRLATAAAVTAAAAAAAATTGPARFLHVHERLASFLACEIRPPQVI